LGGRLRPAAFFFVQFPNVTREIDDRTVAYVLAAQAVFEDLRQVAAQLAGMLVLSATGAKAAAPDHPMLGAAAQLFAQAAENVQHLQPPASDGARVHHDALVRAASLLRDALAGARIELVKPPASADLAVPLVPLRHAYDALQRAASALPGFQMVAFDQGCCGAVRPHVVHLKVDTTDATR
jgi:hypothetical protein